MKKGPSDHVDAPAPIAPVTPLVRREATMAFKNENLDLQHLVRELHVLRDHNRSFKEGDAQDTLLLVAEGAMALIVIERFLRAVLQGEATESMTLFNLLEKALSKNLMRLPWDDQKVGIRTLTDVRNTILHGNFEQAARLSGCASVPEFFRTQFGREIEQLYKVADHLFRQIDPNTGRPA
jgi:hypothetical protein